MTGRNTALIGCAVTLAVSPSRTAAAQTTVTVDFGYSSVRYDGFLRSGALSITPAAQWDLAGGRGLVSARGTYLRFESGNRSIDAQVRGVVLAELGPLWRGEIGATVGASEYADFASFRHGMLEARLHRMSGDRGTWVGASAGSASFGNGPRPSLVAGAGAWRLWRLTSLRVSVDRSVVGDTAYSDARAAARWQRGPLLVDVGMGARFWSRGGGRGVYFETSARCDLGSHLAVVLAGGRYPTDAISGSIAGRYVTVALRLRASRGSPGPSATPARPGIELSSAGTAPAGAARIEIADVPSGVRLVVHAAGASRVEIAGDFTDWQPVTLLPTPTGRWEVVLALSRGLHRVAVRVDGGPWLAPYGTTRVADDYGGEVGLLVVP